MFIVPVVIALVAGSFVRNRRVALGLGVGVWITVLAYLWAVTVGQGPAHQVDGTFFVVAAVSLAATVGMCLLGSLRPRRVAQVQG